MRSTHDSRSVYDTHASTRRAFVARLLWLAAPAALVACGRDEPTVADRVSSSPVEPVASPPVPLPDRVLPLPTREPMVRVRLARVRSRPARVVIGTDDDWLVYRLQFQRGASADDTAPASSSALIDADTPAPGRVAGVLHPPVTVEREGGVWSILDARGFRGTVPPEAAIVLGSARDDDPSAVTVNGRAYPGVVRLVPRPESGDDAFDTVNDVALEAYLPGVLEKELYRHWRLETFAAQAVAARSFACAEHASRAHSHFDLTATASSQVYVGETEHARSIEAVAATRGLVLGYRGRLVPGYYSSCCGGLAADAMDAISNHPTHEVPPLRGRSGPDVCTDAELFSWTIERAAADVPRRVRAYGKAKKIEPLATLDTIRSITVGERNPHGRPRLYDIRTDAGEPVVLSAEALRRALDYKASGRAGPKKRLWSANIEVTLERSRARFDGFGFGHGAGLCQFGAEALARQGMDPADIVRWYYPEVEIVRGWGRGTERRSDGGAPRR